MFPAWRRWVERHFPRAAREGRRRPRPGTARPRLETLEERTVPSTFTVVNTNDSGAGSLRDAITRVNADTGTAPDTIAFAIGTGAQTIALQSALPALTHTVILDGTTQSGFAGAPLIELNGAGAGTGANGLTLDAGHSTVHGLVINRFGGDGILLETNGADTVQGNSIGTDVSGKVALGNGGNGVEVQGTSGNTVGGTSANSRNVISGNGNDGVLLSSPVGIQQQKNVVEGNYIGTDAGGTAALGNARNGVEVGAWQLNNVIGGPGGAARNVISGNGNDGILALSTGNLIEANYVGTNARGTAALGNSQTGVEIGGADNTVGGTTAATRNVVSGNGNQGISADAFTFGIIVQGNYVGTDAGGTHALGNTRCGVYLSDSADDLIGGTAAGARNVISGNGVVGVIVADRSQNDLVEGNLVGTDVTGTAALANPGGGVEVSFAFSNTIGGTTAAARNVVLGGFAGILMGVQSQYNTVEGNFIGTDVTGTRALGSSAPSNAYGIYLDSTTSFNQIGAPGAGNVVSGNTATGVELDGNGNALAGNFIGTDLTGTQALGNAGGVRVRGFGNTIGGTTAGAGNVLSGNLGNGVYLAGGGGNTLQGNDVGTDVTGSHALANSGNGVELDMGESSDTIGGTTAGSGNVLSGNARDGIQALSANVLLVEGNEIGTDATGEQALGNGASGVEIDYPSVGISVGAAGAGNVLSGNAADGVTALGVNSVAILGNLIGTDRTGTATLGNGRNGVNVQNTSTLLLGGDGAGAGNVISGNAGDGVLIVQSQFREVQGNDVGTDATGEHALGNGGNGVEIIRSSFVTVGGTSPTARNVISANQGDGVVLSGGSANTVEGNSIGTDATGAVALGNALNGVEVNGGESGSTVGGWAAGAGNVISANVLDGVRIGASTSAQVQGNRIGTDATGEHALGNGASGVEIDAGAAGALVGGLVARSGNVISGNTGDGILIAATRGSTVRNNLIGTDGTGSFALGNGGNGVHVVGASATWIGGTSKASRNVMSGNGGDGVLLSGSAAAPATNNVVAGNFIGTDATGKVALSNARNGVEVGANASSVTIGGPTAAGGNVVSGNHADGVLIGLSAADLVENNVIGTDVTGTGALANSTNGVEVDGQSNVIGGAGTGNLISGNAGTGVLLYGQANLVAGNSIGTGVTGTTALGNGGDGVDVVGVGNAVGGTMAQSRNVISGNGGYGVAFFSTGSVLQGNYIGTDLSGTTALGNGNFGVSLFNSHGNTVGGTSPGAGNVISGNAGGGVSFATSSANLVQGNFIGTDAGGTRALGNNGVGVDVDYTSPRNTIGGTAAGAGNVIAANRGDGVYTNNSSDYTVLQGNFIGTDRSGTLALGNAGNGMNLSSISSTVGGEAPGAANTIAFNARHAVFVNIGNGNLISANSIFSNGALGIFLNPSWHANRLQAAPALTGATSSAGTTTIAGTLASTRNTTFTIEFFASPTDTPAGQGKTFLGSTPVTTDSQGHATIQTVLNTPVPAGQFITATATDPENDTSEFSNAVTAS